MPSRASALRKPVKSAAKSKTAAKSAAVKPAKKAIVKAPTKAPTKVTMKAGALPEWNLSDLYSGIDAPEIAHDLQKMDADCVAFATDYKGKLAEHTAREDGGEWLAEAVKRYEAIDDLAGRLGGVRQLELAGNSSAPCPESALRQRTPRRPAVRGDYGLAAGRLLAHR